MDKFNYEANGYNRSEVNIFINDVIKKTERRLSTIRVQNKKIEDLENKLTYYKSIEATINQTIEKAEDFSKQKRKLSEEKYEMILTEAKENASRIVNEALIEAANLNRKKQLIEEKMKILKSQLKIDLEKQMKIVEEIDKIDIDEED